MFVKTPTGCIENGIVVTLPSEREVELDTLSVQPTICGADNGVVQLSVANAIGTAQVSLNGAAPTNELTFENLSSGIQTFVVSDSEGCQDSISVNIAPSEGIAILDTLIQHPSCGLDNGRITTQLNNPGSIQDFTINGESASPTITFNLAAGNYAIRVVDVAGCSDSLSVILNPSEAISFEVDSTATTCALNNGTAILTNVVGAPEEYGLDGGPFVETSDFTNLSAGPHTIIARNGICADTVLFFIGSSEAPELMLATAAGTTCGEMNGAAELDAINGTGPYEFNLDSLNNQTGVFESLPAGEYVAYVQDFAECLDSTDVSIASSVAVELTAEVTEGICGELGSIQLIPSFGDNNIYTDQDGNASNMPIYTNLEGGMYTFFVRTDEDCLDTLMVEVQVYGVPEVEVADRQMAFCEEPVGSVTVAGSSGKGILSYALDGVEQEEETHYENLGAGSYTIRVTDETGCTSEMTVDIESTPSVRIEDFTAEQLFCGDVLSAVQFSSEGGTGILTYEITNSVGAVVDEAGGLPEGQYRLTVTDELGCEQTELIIVRKEECQMYIPTAFNPLSAGEDRKFKIGVPAASDFMIETFQIYDRWGNLVYDKKDIDPLTFTEWWDGTRKGQALSSGVYVYRISLGGETLEQVSGTVTLIK